MRTGYNHTKAATGLILGLLAIIGIGIVSTVALVIEITAAETLIGQHNDLGRWLLLVVTIQLLTGGAMFGKSLR